MNRPSENFPSDSRLWGEIRSGARIGLRFFAGGVLVAVLVPAASTGAKAGSGTNQAPSQEVAPTIKVRVNVVQVRVVVRNVRGAPVENLKQDDFRLYDNGKLQAISGFAVDSAASDGKQIEGAPDTALTGLTPSEEKAKAALPDRFVALLFDDLHLEDAEVAETREAANVFLNSMRPGDRVAMYSTSGTLAQEFSGDKDGLKRALLKLNARPKLTNDSHDCPRVSFYMAKQVETLHDSAAFELIVEEALDCAFSGDASMRPLAERMAKSAVQQAVSLGLMDYALTCDRIEAALKGLGRMPGQKTLVFVSPGVSLGADETRLLRIIDEANRMRIVMNSLDARGLYTGESSGATGTELNPQSTLYQGAEKTDQSVLLGELAYGTGGTYFRNSNDLGQGMKQLAGPPELTYVLIFTPQEMKKDGSFHKLRVELTGKGSYQIQARNGYYEEQKDANPQNLSAMEIEDALVAAREVQEMPLELQLKEVATTADTAQLTVITKLDIRDVAFPKVGDRRDNELLVVTAIFDEDGKSVQRQQRTFKLELTDETYDRLLRTGMMIKGDYAVKPGSYVVRFLVREVGEGKMSVRSGVVSMGKDETGK